MLALNIYIHIMKRLDFHCLAYTDNIHEAVTNGFRNLDVICILIEGYYSDITKCIYTPLFSLLCASADCFLASI